MRNFTTIGLAAGLVLGSAVASTAHAHINLLKPTSWLQDDATGGAQEKGGPCGPGGYDSLLLNTDTPSGVVTEFHAGETITVEWTETILHPGYFRIALAENRADLKDPTVPFTDPGNCMVDESKIPTGPHDNVLADGILIQTYNPADGSVSPAQRAGQPNYSLQVTLPNKPCEKCTLQVIQFMENHPPDCIYYHCADLKIVAGSATGDAGSAGGGIGGPGDAGAVDSGHPVGVDGGVGGAPGGGIAAGGTSAGGTAAGGTATGSTGGGTGTGSLSGGALGTPGAGAGLPDAGSVAVTGGTAAGGGTTAGTTPGVDDGMADDGCNCAVTDSSPRYGNLLGMSLLAVGLLIRRRRLQG